MKHLLFYLVLCNYMKWEKDRVGYVCVSKPMNLHQQEYLFKDRFLNEAKKDRKWWYRKLGE